MTFIIIGILPGVSSVASEHKILPLDYNNKTIMSLPWATIV